MKEILEEFGLRLADFKQERIGTGHIHETYRLMGSRTYILQRVNKNVFKQPEVIDENLQHASHYLKDHHPEYQFLEQIPTLQGKRMVYDDEGFPWRMFPYVENTSTINKASTEREAFNAAAGFALLTRNLDGVNTRRFRETIPRFHDLTLRYRQFEKAMTEASEERRKTAAEQSDLCVQFQSLVLAYNALIDQGSLRQRIVHNDTKINNILFDARSEAVCVIDLDTLMPGYFIYDLGDMVRTFVSPADEEESDLSKIEFRREIYDALVRGYLLHMDGVLSRDEKKVIPFAGKMMTYIMALRFLADYLNGDTYYHTSYPGQNLVRAGNQLRLLQILEKELPDN